MNRSSCVSTMLLVTLMAVHVVPTSASPDDAACATCHVSGGGSAAPATCESCHRGVDSGAGEPRPHAGPATLDGSAASGAPSMTCETCHDPHADGVPFRLRSPDDSRGVPANASLDPVSQLCASCHGFTGFRGPTGGFILHPVGRGLDPEQRDLAAAAGLPSYASASGPVIGCGTCHAVHGNTNDDLLRWDDRGQSAACGACHVDGLPFGGDPLVVAGRRISRR